MRCRNKIRLKNTISKNKRNKSSAHRESQSARPRFALWPHRLNILAGSLWGEVGFLQIASAWVIPTWQMARNFVAPQRNQQGRGCGLPGHEATCVHKIRSCVDISWKGMEKQECLESHPLWQRKSFQNPHTDPKVSCQIDFRFWETTGGME